MSENVDLSTGELYLLTYMKDNSILPPDMADGESFSHLCARNAFFKLTDEETGECVIVLSAEGYKLLGRVDPDKL